MSDEIPTHRGDATAGVRNNFDDEETDDEPVDLLEAGLGTPGRRRPGHDNSTSSSFNSVFGADDVQMVSESSFASVERYVHAFTFSFVSVTSRWQTDRLDVCVFVYSMICRVMDQSLLLVSSAAKPRKVFGSVSPFRTVERRI